MKNHSTPSCTHVRHHTTSNSLEPLEARIAPAKLVGLVDVDGDLITIMTSKGTDAELAAVVTTTPNLAGSVPGGVRIDAINLANNPVFDGTDLVVTAKHGPLGGDGLVDVLRVNATNLALGTVTVKGDLQDLDAGKAAPASTIKAINVNSTSGLQVWSILGNVNALNVKNDLRGAEIHIDGAGAKLGTLKIGGSLIGESSVRTGYVSVANGTIGKITIKGDIRGGGTSTDIGEIVAKDITSATINGSIIGGSGNNSGRIGVTNSLGSVTVKGDVIGGTSTNSGLIHSDATLGKVTVNGSLIGGTASHSGSIEGVTGIGDVKIGRDQRGGGSSDTGDIQSIGGGIKSVTIGGSLQGGSASFSGRIVARGGNVGAIKIGGDVKSTERDVNGNLLQDTGIIFAVVGSTIDQSKSNIASINIGGSVIGGGSNTNEQIVADGTIGPVKIGRDVRGGAGFGSGSITSFAGLGNVTIGGSLVGGTNFVTGSITSTSGGSTGNVSIGGSILDGSVFSAGNLGKVTVGGDVLFISNPGGGAISASGTIGAVKIGGSLAGTSTGKATISADLPTSSAQQVAIKSLNIGGRVEHASITAGVGSGNGDAQIGTVTVGGDWIASDLVAGASAGANGFYGDADDTALAGGVGTKFSRIASVVIFGQVNGTSALTNDHFGFVAQSIGAMSVNGVALALTNGQDNAAGTDTHFILGTTRDVAVHEVA